MEILPNILMLSLILIPELVSAEKKKTEDIYFQTCYVCHGDDASGIMPGVADLADSEMLFTETEENIVVRIKAGIQTPGKIAMPPKGGNPELTDDELLSVLRYVKQLIKNK